MTPEEIAARTRLEQEAGRNAVRDAEAKPKDSRGMEGRDTPRLLAFVEPSTAQEWAQLPIDPDVKLPADVRALIACGEAKLQEFQREYKKQRRQRIIDNDTVDGAHSTASMCQRMVASKRNHYEGAVHGRG